MARSRGVGYVVTSKEGAYCVGCYEEGRPVLVLGQHVDVFPTWRVARLMVKRSVAYAIENALNWGDVGHYLIRPLRTMTPRPERGGRG